MLNIPYNRDWRLTDVCRKAKTRPRKLTQWSVPYWLAFREPDVITEPDNPNKSPPCYSLA